MEVQAIVGQQMVGSSQIFELERAAGRAGGIGLHSGAGLGAERREKYPTIKAQFDSYVSSGKLPGLLALSEMAAPHRMLSLSALSRRATARRSIWIRCGASIR